jgi:hypothetical protein
MGVSMDGVSPVWACQGKPAVETTADDRVYLIADRNNK